MFRVLSFFQLLRTIKHLRWEQLAYRPVRLAQYRLYQTVPQLTSHWCSVNTTSPKLAPQAVERVRSVFENLFLHLNASLDKYSQRLNELPDGRYTFLNRTMDLNPIDWNRRYENHLWTYHLHYFDYAVWCARTLIERGDAQPMRYCQRLIESWIEQARIGQSDGWDAYPVSLRVVNWIYAYALIADCYKDRQFLERWRASIYRQLDFLNRHLEFHLLANHLLKNVKALVIGGLVFNEEKLLAKGERLLWREFTEQILEDGGHYERSPMYHAQVLADYLECYALLRSFGRIARTEVIESRLHAMSRFLDAMSNPDGSLALFNDSVNAEDVGPRSIVAAAEKIIGRDNNFKSCAFPHTGYYLWISRDEKEKITVDAGPPSVDYNPAHAHCDLLSYELRLGGRPFIVDSGVHGYAGDRFREYCRSTRAHNTVMFDEREQSETWGSFRMGGRAELIAVKVKSETEAWSFSGEYRPFYDSGLIHERHIRRELSGEWFFEDRLRRGSAQLAASFIHLHPSVRVTRIDNNSFDIECSFEQMKVVIQPFGAEGVKIIEGEEWPIQGWYFPDFGIAQPSATICFHYRVRQGEGFGYKIRQV